MWQLYTYKYHMYECNKIHLFHVHNSLMIINKCIKLCNYHNQEIDDQKDHHPKTFHCVAATDLTFAPTVFSRLHINGIM